MIYRLAFFAFAFLAISSSASGQTLTGTVLDTHNAPIAGASVRLRDREKTLTTVTTDRGGVFTLAPNATPRLELTVEADGFAPFLLGLPNGIVENLEIILRPAEIREDVTISITRTETRLNETPASIVVLTRDTLESAAAQTIDDTLRQVAGFTLFRRSSSKTANPTTHGANLRGVSGSGASRAAVLLDGLSLNDAFGGWTYWSRVPAIAVDQIEVLRGGASSLYGSGGLSGAVTLATSRPGDGERFFRIQTSAGTQSTFDGSLFAAISKNKWTFDIAPEFFKTDGYIPVAEDERGTIDTRANSRHYNTIAGIGRTFGSSSQNENVDEKSTFGRLFFRGNLFSEDRENGTSLTNNATYFRQTSAGGDIKNASAGRFELRTFLQAQVYDQSFSAVSADRSIETLTRLQRVPSQAAGGSLFWTRPFGKHTIASSIEIRDVRGFSDEIGFFAGQLSTASGSGGRERTLAFFANDHWQAGVRVSISFGARFDRWRNFDAHSTVRTLATNAVTTTVFPDRGANAVSPRVSALVYFSEHFSAYGSYSRSFRAPSLNELYRGFRVGNVITQANENLSAERANTFEGGVSYGFDRFAIRGNAYVTVVDDPILSVTLSTTPALITRQRQNVGETKTRGIEIDAKFSPVPELRLSASYLFADARITTHPADPMLVGNHLPQVARHQANFQLAYRPTSRWSLGIQTRFASGQFEDDLNTLRLRSYFTLDATSAFRITSGVEIFAASENVFNSRYDIGLTPNRTVAAPVFVRVGLRLNFGKR